MSSGKPSYGTAVTAATREESFATPTREESFATPIPEESFATPTCDLLSPAV
jgi:hypothetical protein